jgi:hypothetical protein
MSVIWFECKEVKGEKSYLDEGDSIHKIQKNNNNDINDRKNKGNITLLCISNFCSEVKSYVQIGVDLPGTIEDVIQLNKLICIVYWYNQHEYISLFNTFTLECLSANQLDSSRGLHSMKNENLHYINEFQNNFENKNKKIGKTLGICRAPPLIIPQSKSFNGSFFHIFNDSSTGIYASIYVYTYVYIYVYIYVYM